MAITSELCAQNATRTGSSPLGRSLWESLPSYSQRLMLWPLALLLTTSCQGYSQWQHDHISQREGKSTRILYRSSDLTRGIDVEMVKSHNEVTTYLQVHSGSIPEHEGKAKVEFHTGNRTVAFWADLHLGSQRIRLTPSFQKALISCLTAGNPITLQLEGYRQTIHPKAFEKTLKYLDAPPYKIPIHLMINST